MSITARMILNRADVRVETGLSNTVCGMLEERDQDLRLGSEDRFYLLDGEKARALESRLKTLVKWEDVWDDGDGRDGIDVVCLDGQPVAVVRVSGYDGFSYQVAPLDLAKLDEIVLAARALRRDATQTMRQFSLDEPLAAHLDLDAPASPTP